MTFASFLGGTLSWLTLFGQVFVLVLICAIIFIKKNNPLVEFVKKYGMLLAFIIACVSVIGSLAYSEILGYEPCKLCWLQRIMMYPQVVILGIGLYIKDRGAALHAIILSIIGMIISCYHYLLQLGFVPANCSTVGYSVSCAKVFVMHMGYITIPIMALTAFIMNIFLLLMYRNSDRATS